MDRSFSNRRTLHRESYRFVLIFHRAAFGGRLSRGSRFISRRLANILALGEDRPFSLCEPLEAVVLVAQISYSLLEVILNIASGLTETTSHIAKRGASGAEDVARILSDVFCLSNSIIRLFSGDVIKFSHTGRCQP
jgi:hypothetical protein